MIRHATTVALGALAFSLAACAGESGSDGKSALTSLSPEGPSAECPAGGTRVLAGPDANGDGTIDAAEATSSQMICNGAAGAEGAKGDDGAKGASGATAAATQVEVEPKGANCAEGGVRITTGADVRYVCNGAPAAPSPGAPVATAYAQEGIEVSAASMTAVSATLAAPGPGKIVAISSMDAYCYTGGAEYLCPGGTAYGYYTLSLDGAAPASSGEYDYFHLKAGETEATSRTAVFDVAAAGDVTVFVRARASLASYGLFRRSLTLLFIPA